MIGGRGGNKIEALSPAEWLEKRYREIKTLQREEQGRVTSVAGRVSVCEHQLELEEPETP
jgi:hypothetical protein